MQEEEFTKLPLTYGEEYDILQAEGWTAGLTGWEVLKNNITVVSERFHWFKSGCESATLVVWRNKENRRVAHTHGNLEQCANIREKLNIPPQN